MPPSSSLSLTRQVNLTFLHANMYIQIFSCKRQQMSVECIDSVFLFCRLQTTDIDLVYFIYGGYYFNVHCTETLKVEHVEDTSKSDRT